ncbi:hypothetical protein L6164_028550 [Bauhinia variegata]|uniref:Uncharacterized protein n=1 Tax=Bauhinia variegata TaxID=167791 RepID=A0ACB9L628_BAUVA|nr:hypothetical protein L6164_028550 [Bauhinia variegata]
MAETAKREAQAAGCRTSAEANRYLEHKRRREAEESTRRAKENSQTPPPRSQMQDRQGLLLTSSVNEMDVTGYYGADLLSEPEKRLCYELRLPPALYLKMQEVMSVQILSGKVTTKSDAHIYSKLNQAKLTGSMICSSKRELFLHQTPITYIFFSFLSLIQIVVF